MKLFRVKIEAEDFILADSETEALEIFSDRRVAERGYFNWEDFTIIDEIEEVEGILEDIKDETK